MPKVSLGEMDVGRTTLKRIVVVLCRECHKQRELANCVCSKVKCQIQLWLPRDKL